MKLKIYPDALPLGGIASVIEDHRRVLDAHVFVEKDEDADLVIVHASSRSKGEPDITYTHGLYPTQDNRWDLGFQNANKQIYDNISKSLQAVAVSHWGGQLIKRYCGINPFIIHNGIFYNDYERKGNKQGPVLWGKTSINPTCDPADFITLAGQGKGDFVSFVNLPGTQKISTKTRKELQDYLKTCSILVATTKENDSVLIMEAMASGVPVLAYDWGMAKERLRHRQGCYLVPPHNITELLRGYTFLKDDWKRQSEAAHTYAGWFDWELQKPKLEGFLQYTLRVKSKPSTVSIIIPCHNYAKYVGEAIASAKNQTLDCEVIVVDDGSTDNSLQVIQEQAPDKIIHHNTAQGAAQSRNEAIEQATGTHIICLDADDIIDPSFAATLIKSFTKRETAICFTPIVIIDEGGRVTNQMMFRNSPNVTLHQKGLNQVPSCCMFKKDWWERADGYDHFLPFTEDANLWLKIFLLGGKAERITTRPLVKYRRHGENNSLKQAPVWNIFHPHNVINKDGTAILLVGEGLDLYHAYWRLKELAYPVILSDDAHIVPPPNYVVLSAGEDVQNQVKEKINQWTQQFSYRPV